MRGRGPAADGGVAGSAARLEGAVSRAWSLVEEVFDPAAADGWAREERAERLHALARGAEARTAFPEAHARLAADPWFPPEVAPGLERRRRRAEEGQVVARGEVPSPGPLLR